MSRRDDEYYDRDERRSSHKNNGEVRRSTRDDRYRDDRYRDGVRLAPETTLHQEMVQKAIQVLQEAILQKEVDQEAVQVKRKITLKQLLFL